MYLFIPKYVFARQDHDLIWKKHFKHLDRKCILYSFLLMIAGATFYPKTSLIWISALAACLVGLASYVLNAQAKRALIRDMPIRKNALLFLALSICCILEISITLSRALPFLSRSLLLSVSADCLIVFLFLVEIRDLRGTLKLLN